MYKKMIKIQTIDTLAIREKEIFLLLAKGLKTSEIAMQLGIKANTVSTIKKIVLKKMNINNSLELFQFAIEQKLNTL
jgi:DNA-binding CsgD family transcriptional regulator